MNKQDAINIIVKIFEEDFEIPAEKLLPGTHIFTDLGLDSLDMVELIFALQKAFSIQIQDGDEVRAIRTLDDLYNFVLKTIGTDNACNPQE